MSSTRVAVITWAFVSGAVFFPGCTGSGERDPETVTAASSAGVPAEGEPDLAAVRAATERFRDVNVALAAGYIRDPFDLCDTAEMMGRPAELGVMGVHYFRPELLSITAPPNPRVTGTGTHTDFLTPDILIYEPQAGGSFELVAVENLVFADAWSAAGHTDLPLFHGVPYDRMQDNPATPIDEAHQPSRIAIGTSGCIARVRTGCSRSSIRT